MKPVTIPDSEIPRAISVLHDIVMALKPVAQINQNLIRIAEQLEISNKMKALEVQRLRERDRERSKPR
jgi:hypothetical protein